MLIKNLITCISTVYIDSGQLPAHTHPVRHDPEDGRANRAAEDCTAGMDWILTGTLDISHISIYTLYI